MGAAAATLGVGLSLLPNIANAESATDSNTTDVRPMLTCNPGGMVDNKNTAPPPTGVYGAAWMNCDRPFPNTPIVVQVTLTRNGAEVGYGKDECYNAKSCYTTTDYVSNPNGSQRWCARVHTHLSGWGEWNRTFCSNY
ncbi:MAG: hypothetical protein GEU98_05090 [Pseudonocardiaceae bacterium]|nr:hypothetical protein [Pseudonocardiaceae bacterium]